MVEVCDAASVAATRFKLSILLISCLSMSIYLVSSSVLPKPTNHLIFAVCINPPVEFKYENNCVALPWPDPGGETDSISPSGYGPSLFRTIPATIFPIANTGATLRNGHKRAQDIAALAVELGCAQILVLNEHRNHPGLGETPRTAFRKAKRSCGAPLPFSPRPAEFTAQW